MTSLWKGVVTKVFTQYLTSRASAIARNAGVSTSSVTFPFFIELRPVETFIPTEPVIIISVLILMFAVIIAGKVVILFFIADTPIFPTRTVTLWTGSIALREIVDAVISALSVSIRKPGLIIRKTKLSLRIAGAAALRVVLTDSIARVDIAQTRSITLSEPRAIRVSPTLVSTGEIPG